MSEIVTATTVVVASQIVTSSVAAPAAVSAASIGLAGGALVGGVGALASLGYALSQLPIWKELEKSQAKIPQAHLCASGTIPQNFLRRAETNYERLLQVKHTEARPEVFEMVAALAALQAEPLLTAVAEAKFAPEVSAVVAHLPRIDSMSRLQIDQVARQTGDLLHNVVEESRREMHRFVARGFSAALADTGWTIKDEAADGQTTAYLATNNAGQTLAACIEADGKISTDMSGFRGRDCEKAIQTLFRSLEDQGIQLTRTREQPHYLFQGGGILGGATRADQVLQNTRHHHAKRETVESDGSRRRGANSRDRNRGAKRGYVLTALQKLAR